MFYIPFERVLKVEQSDSLEIFLNNIIINELSSNFILWKIASISMLGKAHLKIVLLLLSYNHVSRRLKTKKLVLCTQGVAFIISFIASI